MTAITPTPEKYKKLVSGGSSAGFSEFSTGGNITPPPDASVVFYQLKDGTGDVVELSGVEFVTKESEYSHFYIDCGKNRTATVKGISGSGIAFYYFLIEVKE